MYGIMTEFRELLIEVRELRKENADLAHKLAVARRIIREMEEAKEKEKEEARKKEKTKIKV